MTGLPEQQVRQVIDSGVIAGTVSAPVWLQWLTIYGGAFMVVAGIALAVIRLAIAWREWKRKRK